MITTKKAHTVLVALCMITLSLFMMNHRTFGAIANEKTIDLVDPVLGPLSDDTLLSKIRTAKKDNGQMYDAVRAARANRKNAIVLQELLKLASEDKSNAVVRAGYCYLYNITEGDAAKPLFSEWRRYEDASRTLINEATNIAPNSWLTLIASASSAGAKPTESMRNCQRAVDLYPGLAEVHYELGYYCYKQAISIEFRSNTVSKAQKESLNTLFNKTISELGHSAAIKPSFSSPWFVLAHLYYYDPIMKDSKKASHYAAECLRRVPADYATSDEQKNWLYKAVQKGR